MGQEHHCPVAVAADLEAKDSYLTYLLTSTATIDLQGIPSGDNAAHSVPIEEIYVPVKTLGRESKLVPLEHALTHRRLVIQGDPGSGKTTFLRRMVRELARSGDPQLDLPVRGFPIFIRVSDLDQHIDKNASAPGTPAQRHSPQWIAHYLASGPWGLTAKFIESKLRGDGTMVFLDGLDEAANDIRRRALGRLLEEAVHVYPECRFAVTTRPASFQKLVGFDEVRIEDLDDEAVTRFLDLWSKRLHQTNPTRAVEHRAELRRALDEKLEIRRMARNPVMLTALAVVQWNERRLPEQRAELYDCVLTWLARAREQRPGRANAERCLDRLGTLALAMQNEPKGRLTQIERGAAAEALKGLDKKEAFAFLEAEELDSGIIVSRGTDVRFWHLTFQEFLAARDLAGMKDADQYAAIRDHVYRSEWREVILLLAGILGTKQGSGKVDGLFEQITSNAGPTFPDHGHCVALLNAILQDLRPTGYQATCQRYLAMLEEMKRLFEPGGAKGLDLKTRVAAAEALGVSGHPYIRLPKDADYWCKIPGLGEIKPFLMGRYPVTVWEYGKFVDAGGPVPEKWDEQLLHPSRPVVSVSWDDACNYCEWTQCRLPTSGEWQRAAQGTDERELLWGFHHADEIPVNVRRWVGEPTPVGIFADSGSAIGCHDMAGNVWEWTSTKQGSNYAVRGASWNYNSAIAARDARYAAHPSGRYNEIGFRLARTERSIAKAEGNQAVALNSS